MVNIIILFATIFFSDVLFLGNVFFAGDNLSINAPAKVLFFQMLKSGHLPLWNPYSFSGTPFLADINLGLLSPFNIFYLFFSPLRALTLSIVLAVTLCGIGMYLFARSSKLSSFASLITALVFMFSGTVMTHTMNTAILNTIVFLPFILTTINYLIVVKKIKYSLLTSLLLTLSFFGGHIQYFYYITIFSFIYILCSPLTLKEKVKNTCLIYIPVLFLGAVQLFPFLEYAKFSTRPQQSLDYAGSVPLVSFIHLLLPNFFGVMKNGTSWGATSDINGYVGIIPLIISLIAVLKIKSHQIKFFAIAVAISLLIAVGKHSPVYLFCFYVIPFFSRFRSPSSILVIYTFALSILTGYGTHLLLESGKIKLNKKFIIICFITSCSLLGMSLFTYFNLFHYFQPFLHSLNAIKKTALVTRFLEYAPSRMHIIFNLWTENIITVFVILNTFFIFLYVVTIQKKLSTYLKFLFILLIASELMFFARNNYIVSKETTLQTAPAIEDFFKKDMSLYRILVLSDPGAKPPYADPAYFENEGRKAMNLLQPNTNILQGLESVTGYASIVPSYYANYMNSKKDDPTSITLPTPVAKQLDELGVKYVVTAGRYENEIKKMSKYHLVLEYKDSWLRRTFHIYENAKFYPRAYALDNKNNYISSAQITAYSPNQITISAFSFTKGTLILSQMYYPGWTAVVNNKKIPLSKYKVFQSVPVEKGENKITFTYRPLSFVIGFTLSLIAWIFTLQFLGFIWLKEHQKISKKLHVGKPKIKKKA